MILPLLLQETPDFGLSVESVFARQIPARTRSLIRIDPVEDAIIRDKLVQDATWEPREVNGWKAAPAGYVWFKVRSPKRQILQLNANGVSMIYMNGEPRLGDVYGYGAFFIPVELKSGINDILLYGFRGDGTLNWRKPDAELEIDRFDATLPSFNPDTLQAQGQWGGFVVHNNSNRLRRVKLNGNERLIPLLGTIKIPVRIPNKPAVEVTLVEGKSTLATQTFELEKRRTGEHYKRTFLSPMDGSAQYYSVVPATQPNPKVMVLSLHGASVEATSQAGAYGPKDFCDIICPTNRRPFGFNWEGIGRKDALEVMDHAKSLAKYDPSRIMLTGHSMGGHGTWHLGAHYPGLFAAIAPCAGWISFDTYAGGANYDTKNPNLALLARANNPSNPLLLKENFAQYAGVYIHHGGADDNVPVTEARTMRDALQGIAKVTYSEIPGMGHWFDNDPAPGADSVDWPGIFELFQTAQKADPLQRGEFSFRTLDPAIVSDFGIGAIAEQAEPFNLSQVNGKLKGKAWQLRTENVLRLTMKQYAEVDGQAVNPGSWERVQGKWIRDRKWATVHGWNSVYANNVQMIVAREDKAFETWAWSKVRYDAEQLWYRANATPAIVGVSDADAKSNQLAYFPSEGKGDLAAFVIAPLPKLRAGITGTTPLGWRFTERFPLFSPGIAYPDNLAVDVSMLQKGASSIKMAQFRTNW